jgi:hypothetical protein
MKHFKLFEQFIQDLDTSVNESNKWTKSEFEALAAFAKKLSKVDPKEFDPSTYKGIQSAVMNIKAVTSDITLFGDEIWNLKNKDKCTPKKFEGSSWTEATEDEANKGLSVTEEYIKACEVVFQEGIKAIQLIEKGQGEKLESILPKLEADTDKLHKMNRKFQKTTGAGKWGPKKEYFDEQDKAKFQFEIDVLKKYQAATSNKEVIDEIQTRIDRISSRA